MRFLGVFFASTTRLSTATVAMSVTARSSSLTRLFMSFPPLSVVVVFCELLFTYF